VDSLNSTINQSYAVEIEWEEMMSFSGTSQTIRQSQQPFHRTINPDIELTTRKQTSVCTISP